MSDDERFEFVAKIAALRRQRDDALDQVVTQHAQLALAGKRIGELEHHVKALSEQVSELSPKNEAGDP